MNDVPAPAEIAGFVLQRAKESGAALAEVYINNNKELSIEVRKAKIETMKLAEERGLGLRIISGGRTGFAFTSDLGRESLTNIVSQALLNAANTSPDKHRHLPDTIQEYPHLDLYDPLIRSTRVEDKIEMALTMEESAMNYDPRVRIIEGSSYQDVESEIFIANSLGLSAGYQSSFCGLYLSLVAGHGDDSQTGFSINYSLNFKDLDPVTTGRDAAQKALRMLGAKPGPTRQVPVLMEPYVATGFLGLLAPALSAEAVQRGRSLFAGRVGQGIASPIINIVDDGSLPGGIASSPFDGEGIPTSRTTLIKEGVLQGYLHNTYTASVDGVRSTGNGVRYSYKSTPEVGITNFYLEAGQSKPDDLIKEIESGLLVTEIMGLHTANPISGDFSLGASGIWIEKGTLKEPVRGIAMAGNIIDLLNKIDGVGDDLTFFGPKGSPTVRISAISISGQ